MPRRATRDAPVAEQPAFLGPTIAAEVAARNVEDRLDVEIALAPPEIAEGDALGEDRLRRAFTSLRKRRGP